MDNALAPITHKRVCGESLYRSLACNPCMLKWEFEKQLSHIGNVAQITLTIWVDL